MPESKECKEAKSSGGSVGGNAKLSALLKKQNKGDVLRLLYPYFQSKISYDLEEFFSKHLDVFDYELEENKLEYTDVFKKYEKLFEGFLEEFVDLHQLDRKEFYDELNKVLQKPQSGSEKILVKLLVAQTDYQFFVNLMKDKKRQQDAASSEGKS